MFAVTILSGKPDEFLATSGPLEKVSLHGRASKTVIKVTL